MSLVAWTIYKAGQEVEEWTRFMKKRTVSPRHSEFALGFCTVDLNVRRGS